MNQLKLYKTIESFANKEFESIEALLFHVIHQIVQSDRIEIQGGRIWRLNTQKLGYELHAQVGATEKIKSHFILKLDEYRLFKQLPRHKTIIANESNEYLRSKGIKKFAATGVGELVKVKDMMLYPYVLSFNTNLNHEQLAATLNIIGDRKSVV